MATAALAEDSKENDDKSVKKNQRQNRASGNNRERNRWVRQKTREKKKRWIAERDSELEFGMEPIVLAEDFKGNNTNVEKGNSAVNDREESPESVFAKKNDAKMDGRVVTQDDGEAQKREREREREKEREAERERVKVHRRQRRNAALNICSVSRTGGEPTYTIWSMVHVRGGLGAAGSSTYLAVLNGAGDTTANHEHRSTFALFSCFFIIFFLPEPLKQAAA